MKLNLEKYNQLLKLGVKNNSAIISDKYVIVEDENYEIYCDCVSLNDNQHWDMFGLKDYGYKANVQEGIINTEENTMKIGDRTIKLNLCETYSTDISFINKLDFVDEVNIKDILYVSKYAAKDHALSNGDGYLSGVTINTDGNIIATDGYRLIKIDTKMNYGNDYFIHNDILKFLKKTKEKTLKMVNDGENCIYKVGDIIIKQNKVIISKAGRFKQLFDGIASYRKINLNHEQILDEIDFMNKFDKNIKYIGLDFKKEKLNLSGIIESCEVINSELNIENDEDFKIYFDIKYLKELLKDQSEKTEYYISSNKSPMFAIDGNITELLLPVRI